MATNNGRFNLSRRQVVIGGVGAAGGLVMISRSADKSGPRDRYFLAMQSALKEVGIGRPTLVIDKARLEKNIDALMGHLPVGMAYRIVAKSLPSLDLLKFVRSRAGSDRLMTFNEPMLSTLSLSMPDVDQLLGKPLPIAGAQTYFDNLPQQAIEASRQIQWLIDTPERLGQYAALATSMNMKLRINIEIDVGLHRGGFMPGPVLKQALESLQMHDYLEFAGFLGYEPHLSKIPTLMGLRERATESAWKIYRECIDIAVSVFGASIRNNIVRNSAGSPTYRLYQNLDVANEIAAGSCLVKPAGFDTDLLEDHQPASFIATPVIKTASETDIPGLEFASGFNRFWNPNTAQTVFIYGGYWKAKPVDPPGLQYNQIFGRSSNQEMLNGGRNLQVKPDDFVFLRPTQSEAVFLQFGDIAVYDNGKITELWPVFPASA